MSFFSRNNHLTCPRCGQTVRIPRSWMFGIERLFYCEQCKFRFSLKFKWGAIFMALALLAGSVAVQLVGLLGGGLGIVLAIPVFITVWLVWLVKTRRCVLIFTARRRFRTMSRSAQNNASIVPSALQNSSPRSN